MIYKRTGTAATAVELESAGFGGGRINKTSGGYEANYHITDHLGSVRVVFRNRSNAVARNDFYAFGNPDPLGQDRPRVALARWGAKAAKSVKTVDRFGDAVYATHSVYQGFNATCDVKYIGITGRDPKIKFAEYIASGEPRATLDTYRLKA